MCVFCFSFASSSDWAWGQSLPNFCGVYQKASQPTSLLLSNMVAPYIDRFGNTYTAQELNVYNYTNLQLRGASSCPDNYFTLAFNEAGGAFSAAEMATIEQVFCDLSQIITAADGVNNVLIGINKNSNLLSAAAATPLFENTCGITQPLIWEKINSTSGQYPIGFAFGLIDIKPIPAPGLTWYNGPTSGIGPGQVDLYSAVLHEALHILGFASRIDLDGIPEDGGYSRWDTYLYSTLQNDYLVYASNTNPNCCNEHAFNFTDFTMPTSLNGDCPLSLYFRDGSTNIASVNYIGGGNPTSDNEMLNKLSHLAGTCDDPPTAYVMQGLTESEVRRDITSEELSILCKLGYTVSSGEGCSNSCVVLPADDNYTLVLSEGNTLIIPAGGATGVLNNDIVTPSNATISLVSGCGNMGGAVSYNNVTHQFTVTAPPGITPGMYSFCYALTGCENWCGQATVNVLVIDSYIPTECNDASCNLVCFGDFEAFIPLSDTYSVFSPYYGQLGLDYYEDETNYANYPIFEPWMPTPDIYAYNGNNYILSIIQSGTNGYSTEDVYLPLSEAVAPGCSITVSFDANTECHDQDVTYQFFALNNAFVDMNGVDCGEIPNFYTTMMCNTGSTAICPSVTATCMTFANCVANGVSTSYPCGIPINNDSPTWDGSVNYNPNLGLSSHRSFTWTNTTSEPITHLIILPTIEDIAPGTWINAYLDNVVITSDCHPNVTVQSEPVSTCIGNQTSVEYTVCVTGDDTSPVTVSLQAALPLLGVTFASGGDFDAIGAATVTLTPGNCTTLTLNLQVGNSFVGSTSYPVYMNASATNYCYDGNSTGQTTQLNIEACDPLEMCLTQNLNSYLAFNSLNEVVTYGSPGSTANYTSPGDANTSYTDWTPTNNPFGNAAIVRINGDLVIDATSEIRMTNMHFQFGPSGRIIVKRNARLIIQGGTFESGSSCMWQGIQVWGPGENTNQSDTNTGFLSIAGTQAATIKDAIIAIATTRLDLFDFTTINTTLASNDFGGVPYALNNSTVTILPNINSLQAHAYGAGWLNIQAAATTNITDCFYGILVAHIHAALTVAGTLSSYYFTNCNFATNATALRSPFNTVAKSEAGLVVLNVVANTKVAVVDVRTSQFNNLSYGIRGNDGQRLTIVNNQFTNCKRGLSAQMTVAGVTPLFKVQGNTMTDCEIGIQADALNIAITDNTINGTGTNNPNSVGMFLRGSNFLIGSVNANISNITGNPSTPLLTLPGNVIEDANIGIALMDNGGYANQINNNNIHDVQTAIHAIRQNTSVDIHCNLLNFAANGIAAQTWDGVNGDLDDIGDCSAGYPAHNTFSHLDATFTDLYKDATSLPFNYEDIGFNALTKSTGITGNDCIPVGSPCNQPAGMAPLSQDASKALSRQVFQYQIDSNFVAAQTLLEQNAALPLAARKLIQHYYETGVYTTAHNMLDAMSLATQDDQQFYTLHKLALQLTQEGKTLQQISTTQTSTLLQIANSPTTAAYQAQAMLYQARGYEFPVIIPQLPNTGLGYGYTVFKADDTKQTITPFVPNPTTGVAQLVYNLPTDTPAVLTLTDINGKVLQQVSLTGNGIYDLDTRPLSNGLYLYAVQQNGNVLLRQKLVVIK